MSLIITNISTKLVILLISLIFHFIIFILVSLGFFGISIKKKFIYILNRINLSSLFYFIIIIILFISFDLYFYKNLIFLDNEIHMVIDNQHVTIKGEIVKDLFDNLGTFGSFVTGSRIAAMLLAKHNMGILPKMGIILVNGTQFAISYKILNKLLTSKINGLPTSQGGDIIVGPTHIEATIQGSLTDFARIAKDLAKPKTNSISNNFKLAFNNANFEIKPNFLNNKNPLTTKFLLDPMEWKGTLSVTSEVKKVNIDWTKPSPMYTAEFKSNLQTFIHSPLENENFISELITDILTLEFAKIYSIIMLSVILACKLLIKSDSIQFNFLKKFLIGHYINLLLVKYINIWQKSNNIWIFSILIILLLSSTTSFLALIKLKQLF